MSSSRRAQVWHFLDCLSELKTGLTAEFARDTPPQQATLPANDIDSLMTLASASAGPLHDALRSLCESADGEYHVADQKDAQRVNDKARADYAGDLTRVIDVERGMAVFDDASCVIFD